MKRDSGESGSVMIVVLVSIMAIAGFSGIMLTGALGSERSTSAAVEATKLLFVAEAGLDYNYVMMAEDPLYPVRDLSFQVDPAEQTYRSPVLTLDAGASRQTFQYQAQYLRAGVPVAFTDRSSPSENYDEIKVTCTAANPRATRTIASWYRFEIGGAVRGAIVSDMTPEGGGGSNERRARKGNVIFSGDEGNRAAFGDIVANGSVSFNMTPLDHTNVDDYLIGHQGMIRKDLVGTEEEVADFTVPGGTDQLLDFERFRAAAAAGAGQIFTSLADFAAAMNAANAAGDKLEGITVLEIDPAVEGATPGLYKLDVPEINITGTLVLMFAEGTDPNYALDIESPLNINAADLSQWDIADRSTYTTGYPGVYEDPYKKPTAVEIAPGFKNFAPDDDYPAIMLNNGVLTLRGNVNICGVIYGPSFMDIESSADTVQYVNGAIYTGGGIYLNSRDGVQAVNWDPNTVNRLQTKNGKGEALVRTGYAILN